jgi:Putative transmembrane protein (PGPGW)
VLLAIGAVLLIAPGPGLLVIALALAVFATEYPWARRHLAAVQARARSAALKTAASPVATASAVLFCVGATGLGTMLILTDLLPFSGPATGRERGHRGPDHTGDHGLRRPGTAHREDRTGRTRRIDPEVLREWTAQATDHGRAG